LVDAVRQRCSSDAEWGTRRQDVELRLRWSLTDKIRGFTLGHNDHSSVSTGVQLQRPDPGRIYLWGSIAKEMKL
jgi:molybdate-binding protein